MIYQGDIGLYLSGSQVPIKKCGIFVTQPKIKQIAQFGEDDFLMATQLFADTENFIGDVREGNPLLGDRSDFQILMIILHQDSQLRDCVDKFFALAFPDYNVEFSKNSIDFKIEGTEGLKGSVNPFNYESFSQTIKELFQLKGKSESDYNPANDKAKEIAEKLRKGREKANKSSGKSQNVGSLFGTYISILSVGMSMDMNIFYDYTPFQIYDTFNRYWMKVQSDFYTKISTTPMMDTSKMEAPQEWTDNIYI